VNTRLHAPITHRAFFRFYEELNDFLDNELRKKAFPYEFKGRPSIKDTIEAIGVPHTEIDLILVDGESVGFNYKLRGDESVSVYPVFESLDITPIVRLRAKPLRKTRFVVDVHLGKLAQKLRLLGFDTLFRNDFSDSEIVELSLQENRIILTRDKGILKYSAVRRGYWIRNNELKDQLKEVVKRLQLEDNLKPFTRCSNCNGLLHPVDKSLVQDRLPKTIIQFYNNFVECKGCKSVYWQGSHYKRICELIEEVRFSH
jgi:uncharacterized protein with PIN domain